MFALIQNSKVIQIENFIFPVSEDLIWVACDSSVTTDHYYINGQFKITDKSDAEFLLERKNKKIIQLKANRNEALEKPFVDCQAHEWSEDGELPKDKVYFEFSTKSTGVQLTEPNTIILAVMLGSIVKYSCSIIEGENRREGYIVLNQEVALSISAYLTDRGTTCVAYAIEKEVEIHACTTEAQLDAIDITF